MADLDAITTIRLVEAFEEIRTLPAAETIAVGAVVGVNSSGAVQGAHATSGPVLAKGMALNAATIRGRVDVARVAILDVGDILGDLAYGHLIYYSNTEGRLSDAAVSGLAAIGEVIPAQGVITTYDKLLRLYIDAR